ncbi:hypothetical protein CHS0354_036568 [Potamilus streckersoni]|uniref:Phosphate transporter n=1 Tax=Potamilus streckersoni TaxID=2493646 RepID=A0AAE0RR05_9BIVA|nr:hypothetical protein CHS0354_036568 [Potamilus streckersoni]
MLIPDEYLWMVIVGFIIAFVLAFGIGANDVANSFGTSVGAKVLTLRQACILGTIFEILGAVLIGARVSNTIRKGIISTDAFNGTESVFMVGNVAALSGSCIWLLVATFFKLPVSGTHSIVGATIGFSLVAHGLKGISWSTLGMIVASWFVSPLLSGLASAGLFLVVHHLVLKKKEPLEYGLRLLPIFYSVTLAINLFSIFYEGSELLHFNKIPLYGTFILTFGPAIIAAFIVRILVVPYQRRQIEVAMRDAQDTEALKKQEEEFSLALEKELNEATNRQVCTYKFDDEVDNRGRQETKFITEDKENFQPIDLMTNGATSTPMKKNGILLKEKDVKVDPEFQGTKITGTASVASSMPLLANSTTQLISSQGYVNSSCDAKKSKFKKYGSSGNSSRVTTSTDSSQSDISAQREEARRKVEDKPETASLFSFLQILTAIFGSFAHGGNDVSNCIGPVVALWVTATTGSAAQEAPVPIWILVYGGAGISVGLWIWGRRVIQTMGEDLTKITPSSGFCIEIGSALTVLIASNVGIPISTTHCKVGSVVITGRVRSKDTVDWKLFRNIILAWFVTVPVSGGLSAAFMFGLMQAV